MEPCFQANSFASSRMTTSRSIRVTSIQKLPSPVQDSVILSRSNPVPPRFGISMANKKRIVMALIGLGGTVLYQSYPLEEWALQLPQHQTGYEHDASSFAFATAPNFQPDVVSFNQYQKTLDAFNTEIINSYAGSNDQSKSYL